MKLARCDVLRPIHVLYLIGELGFGGSERQLYSLLKNRRREGFRASIVVFNQSEYGTLHDAMEETDVHVYRIPETVKGVVHRSAWLYRLLKSLKPDVIHSWTVHDNAYAGIIGSLCRIPVRWGSLRGSLTLKGFSELSYAARWISLYAIQKLLINADSIKHELLAVRYPLRKIFALPNGVDENTEHTISLEDRGIPDTATVIGVIGNLRRVKNHAMFVRVMAIVKQRHPDVFGVIVGQPISYEPDVESELMNLIGELELERNVRVLGFHTNIQSLLKRCAVICHTSQSEGTPNVILEAMVTGIPVVATRVGGIPQLIDDSSTGFVVEPDDAAHMAERVTMLLDDPSLRQRIGESSQRFIREHHSSAIICARLFHMYWTSRNGQVK